MTDSNMDKELVNRTITNWLEEDTPRVVEAFRSTFTRLRKLETGNAPEMVIEKDQSRAEGLRQVLIKHGFSEEKLTILASADLSLIEMAETPEIRGDDGVNTTLIAGHTYWVKPNELICETISHEWQASEGGSPCNGAPVLFSEDRVLVVVPEGDDLNLANNWQSEAFNEEVGWVNNSMGASVLVLVFRSNNECRFAITV